MIDYVLKNIDREQWQDFRAVAALQGKTVRVKLLEYVEAQGKMLTAMVLCKGNHKIKLNKGGDNL